MVRVYFHKGSRDSTPNVVFLLHLLSECSFALYAPCIATARDISPLADEARRASHSVVRALHSFMRATCATSVLAERRPVLVSRAMR